MKFMYFSLKYCFIYNRLFWCNHTCYCIKMVSVTLASRYITSVSPYHPRYQSISLMYIRCLIPRNFAELAEAVPIWLVVVLSVFSMWWPRSYKFVKIQFYVCSLCIYITCRHPLFHNDFLFNLTSHGKKLAKGSDYVHTFSSKWIQQRQTSIVSLFCFTFVLI